jgi:hypothetical protein
VTNIPLDKRIKRPRGKALFFRVPKKGTRLLNIKLIAYTNAPRLIDMGGNEWQEGQVPCPLYRYRQGTLMLSTGTSSTPGINLSPIRYVTAQF